MSSERRKRKQVTLLSFMKKVCEKEKDNILKGLDSQCDLPQPEKGLNDDLQNEVSEHLRNDILCCSQNSENNLTPVPTITVTDFDIANFIKIEEPLSSIKLMDIFSNIWFPNQKYSFPTELIKSKNLRFQMHWFEKWHWLSYSQKMDGAFCKYCFLFSSKEVGAHKSSRWGN